LLTLFFFGHNCTLFFSVLPSLSLLKSVSACCFVDRLSVFPFFIFSLTLVPLIFACPVEAYGFQVPLVSAGFFFRDFFLLSFLLPNTVCCLPRPILALHVPLQSVHWNPFDLGPSTSRLNINFSSLPRLRLRWINGARPSFQSLSVFPPSYLFFKDLAPPGK